MYIFNKTFWKIFFVTVLYWTNFYIIMNTNKLFSYFPRTIYMYVIKWLCTTRHFREFMCNLKFNVLVIWTPRSRTRSTHLTSQQPTVAVVMFSLLLFCSIRNNFSVSMFRFEFISSHLGYNVIIKLDHYHLMCWLRDYSAVQDYAALNLYLQISSFCTLQQFVTKEDDTVQYSNSQSNGHYVIVQQRLYHLSVCLSSFLVIIKNVFTYVSCCGDFYTKPNDSKHCRNSLVTIW